MKESGRRNERGGGVGVFIGILAVLIVVGIGVYLWSDPARTKMNTAFREMSEWTPENIAKDPINYLNFCEEETNKALDKLKASEISIAQRRGKLAGMKDDAAKKITVGKKALRELKESYRKAEADDSFPVTWHTKSLDKTACRKQIVSLHEEVAGQKMLLGKIDTGVARLDLQQQRVLDQRSKAKAQLTEIQTNREMLKVQEISDDITNQLVDMKGVLQATIATADESSGVATLDDLTASAETSIDEEKFSDIMSEK